MGSWRSRPQQCRTTPANLIFHRTDSEVLPACTLPQRVHTATGPASDRVLVLLLLPRCGLSQDETKRTISRASCLDNESRSVQEIGGRSRGSINRHLRKLFARAECFIFQHC